MQNAFIESSRALTAGQPATGRIVERNAVHLAGTARVALGCWRLDYNGSRPHSRRGWKTPSEFAFTFHPRRELALRYAKGSAPGPGVPHCPTGQIQRLGANGKLDKTWGNVNYGQGAAGCQRPPFPFVPCGASRLQSRGMAGAATSPRAAAPGACRSFYKSSGSVPTNRVLLDDHQ
jgi:hypothetical protein